MDIASSEKILRALELMGKHLGIVSTINEDDGPDSAVVYFYFDKDLNVYFMTHVGSRKYKNILRNPKIAFVTYSEHPPKTIQLQGTAKPVTDPKEKEACICLLKDKATKNSPLPPINQMNEVSDKSEIAVVKITVSWARLGDFDIYREHNIFHETKNI